MAQATSTHQQNSATARGSDMTPFNLLACSPGLLVADGDKELLWQNSPVWELPAPQLPDILSTA